MRLPRLAAGVARPRRLLLHSLAMGALITLLMASGTGSTFAVWTSQATATTTAGGAQLDVTTSFANANAVFADHVLSSTGSFTIGNATDTTGTTPGSYTATLGYTGDSALASALALKVWPYSVASPCTAAATPAGVVATGTWASVTGVISGTLAAPGSITYCLRMTGTERSALATSDGELLINPSVTATLSVGSWTDTASATAVQKTAYIFPAFTPTASTWYQVKNIGTQRCVDVHGAETAAGTGVIDYPCKTAHTATVDAASDYNQHWKFSPTDTGYYTLAPRNATTLRMDVVGQSAGTLAPIDVQAATSNPIRDSQEWQLQLKAPNVYQLVNRLSGLCLQPYDTGVYAGDVEYAQAVCDGTKNQTFALTLMTAVTPTMTQVACAPSGSGVTYSWTGAAVDTYEFQVSQNTAGPFATVKTAPVGSTSVTILPADMATQTADGKYSVRSFWNNTALAPTAPATLSLWKATNAGVTTLHCAPDSDIAVTAAVTPASIDQNVAGTATWTITAVNNGPLPSTGTLTITLPATSGYTLSASAGTCSGTGTATRPCAFSALPVGSSLTVTVTRAIPTNQTVGSLTVTGAATVTAANNTDPVAANNSASAALTIVDRQAPTVPGRRTANAVGTTSATVRWWESTDNVGVTFYDVYRDGALVASVESPEVSYTDSSLMSGASYVYTVMARDAVGNVSAASTSDTVTTDTSGEISNSSNCIRLATSTTIDLAGCTGNGSDARSWSFAQASSGFVKISNVGTSTSALAASASGPTVIASTGTSTAQEWKMTPSGSGYTFESRSRPGLCLQRNSSPGVVVLATCSTASSQVWAVN